MGANTFTATATGATATIAFGNARSSAAWEHEADHDQDYPDDAYEPGYSGTIAEKDSFIMVNVAVEARQIITRLQARKAVANVAAQRKVRKAQTDDDGLVIVTSYLCSEGREETMKEACARTRKSLATAITRLLGARSRNRAVARYIDAGRFDKYGPAACIQLSATEWFFCGVAAS